MEYRYPSHAFEPAVDRDAPHFQNVIDVSTHGFPEELEVLAEIEQIVVSSGEPVRLQRTSVRDGALYVIIQIGMNVASNLISHLITRFGKDALKNLKDGRKPVIYISPAYAPKAVFELPRQAEEAQEYFRRYPSVLNVKSEGD